MELNRIMNEHKVSISDLAERLNINQYTIRNYINNPKSSRKSTPPIDIMARLNEEFGYDFYYVIPGKKTSSINDNKLIFVKKDITIISTLLQQSNKKKPMLLQSLTIFVFTLS